MAKYICNCIHCGAKVEVEYDDYLNFDQDEACAGILCDECAEDMESDDETDDERAERHASDADYLAALWANPW